MCGIVGFLNLGDRALDPTPSDAYLSSMLESILHRGPDEEGRLIEGPLAMGMRRLSIIDLASGQQPISGEDGSVKIVFNGEIYNYQALQKLVQERGHTLKTSSDTETIVHLYEEFGVDCLQHLEGMFAFAIWDAKKKRLFIARDRIGEKPLYWGNFDGQFLFGSELKGILAHPAARRRLDPLALRQYLASEYVPAPQSILDGIYKLQPGHFLLVENGAVSTKRYWNLPEASSDLESITDQEAKDELERLLTESIRLRLISEVPLGVFLSGGIDSSIITAIASRLVSHKLQTFSVGFEDPSFDESEHAMTVANHLGCDHHVIPFKPELAEETLNEVWRYLDEPLGDASILPTYQLSKETRKSVTVALSGDGGDELLGGYPTYLAHRMAGTYNLIPSFLRHGLINPVVNSLPVSLNNLSFDYKLKRFTGASDEAPLTRHLRWMGSHPVPTHTDLLSEEILETTSTIGSEADLFSHLDPKELVIGHKSIDIADSIMRLDIRSYLADDLLVKADRATMATSLEARVPFLAYPLIEFAVNLPTRMKYRGKTSKFLLRSLASDYLPEDIIKRPKKGFGIPVAKWLRSDFKHIVEHLLSETYLKNQGIFKPSAVRRMILEHDNMKVDRRKELWTLLMFQQWWDRFLGPNSGELSKAGTCTVDKSSALATGRK